MKDINQHTHAEKFTRIDAEVNFKKNDLYFASVARSWSVK